MKFIGVDLGWTSGASGLSCLCWQNNQLQLLETTTKQEIAAILSWIDRWTPARQPALVAVDAPTIIPNQTGMRIPDKLTHKYFGSYHAGCYPANLSRPFAERTVSFSNSLTARKFRHAPIIEARKLGRYQIEVFPHPATVNLFGLKRILKYKKGNLAERKAELQKLRDYIIQILPTLEPPLYLDRTVNDSLPAIAFQTTGKELKIIEDRLDSLICAYVAAYWWYWGQAKNLVLGDLNSGYIVIPQPEK